MEYFIYLVIYIIKVHKADLLRCYYHLGHKTHQSYFLKGQ